MGLGRSACGFILAFAAAQAPYTPTSAGQVLLHQRTALRLPGAALLASCADAVLQQVVTVPCLLAQAKLESALPCCMRAAGRGQAEHTGRPALA
jgi:hypothetical protein